MLLRCNVVLSDVFRSISRCQGWLWTADRWPSVSPQPWVGGLPLDPVRLWAHSYGSKPLKSLTVWGQSHGKYKMHLCASLSQTTEAKKKEKLEPIPITDQPSEHVYLFNPLSLLYVSLSISLSLLFEWIGSQTGLQPGSFCLSLGFWLQLSFSFFWEKKKSKVRK